MRGISLPLETIVLLILFAIVLGALLAFFSGIFNPAVTRIHLIQEKESLCIRMVGEDPKCNNPAILSKYVPDFKKYIGNPREDPVCPAGSSPCECCRAFCGTCE